MEMVTPFKEIIDAIKASGGDAFKHCYQCGLCDTVCPWNRVRNFSMRKLVREATFGLTEIESEDIWRCTTCGKCPQVCPRDVRQIESGVALRRIATEYDVFPRSVEPIRAVAASLRAEGNPFGEERATRGKWAEGLAVKPFTEGMEFVYMPGCYLSYDPRAKKIARATVEILNKAGVDFGILGPKESCCGESIRKTGDEALFKTLARQNIRALIDHGVKKVLVVEPGGGSSVQLLRDGVEETFGIDAFRNRLRGHVREELERLTSGNRGVIDLSKVAEAETAAAKGEHIRVRQLLGAWPAPLAIFLRTPDGQMLAAEARALIAKALGLLGTACVKLGDSDQGEEIFRLAVFLCINPA